MGGQKIAQLTTYPNVTMVFLELLCDATYKGFNTSKTTCLTS